MYAAEAVTGATGIKPTCASELQPLTPTAGTAQTNQALPTFEF
jgi:hypothetical protein